MTPALFPGCDTAPWSLCFPCVYKHHNHLKNGYLPGCEFAGDKFTELGGRHHWQFGLTQTPQSMFQMALGSAKHRSMFGLRFCLLFQRKFNPYVSDTFTFNSPKHCFVKPLDVQGSLRVLFMELFQAFFFFSLRNRKSYLCQKLKEPKP